MNTIFLVKKNPNLPDCQDNWLILQYTSFIEFWNTEEGQRRRKSFYYMRPQESGDVGYVTECGEEKKKKWKAEDDRHDYLEKTRAAIGYKVLTFSDLSMSMEEPIHLEELICDLDAISVEDSIIRSEEIRALRAAINKLSEDDLDLIVALYLSSNPLTDKAYAENTSISRATLFRRKMKTLSALGYMRNLPASVKMQEDLEAWL